MSFLSIRDATNSTIDPKHDPDNPLKYIPSNALTTVGVAAFLLVSISLTLRLRLARWSGKYLLPTIIGSFTMTAGLALRYSLHNNPDSKGVYIGEDLLVVLSPCAFIAGNYSLLGRIASNVQMGQYLLIRPERLTKVFVSSDVITFLIQAAGGTMSTSHDANTIKLGSNLLKIGMILQFLSYIFYTVLYFIWLFRVRTNNPNVWNASHYVDANGTPISPSEYRWYNDWRALAGALVISCIAILVRSVYRTIEGTQGYDGALATNEHTFYACDTLPLFIGVGIYAIFWPGHFINPDQPRPLPGDASELKTKGYESSNVSRAQLMA